MTACVHHTNVRLTQSAAGQPSPRAGGAIRGRTILKFEPNKITRLILLSVGVLDSQIISVGKTQTQIWVVQNEAQSYCGFFVLGPYIWYNNCKEPKLWVWSAVPWDPQFQRMASDYPSMDYLSANFCLFPFSSLSSPWLLHRQFPEPCSVSHDLSQFQATAKASLRSLLLTEHFSAFHCSTIIPITWFYLHCHVGFLQKNKSARKVVANCVLPSVSWGALLRSRSAGKLLWHNWKSRILSKPFFREILPQVKRGHCWNARSLSVITNTVSNT